MDWTENLPYLCQLKDRNHFTIIYFIAGDEAYDYLANDSVFYKEEDLGYYELENLLPVAPLSDILNHYPEALI